LEAFEIKYFMLTSKETDTLVCNSQISDYFSSKAITTMEGHCLCGAIVVKVNDSELFSDHRRGHLCHCRNCRRVAGGIFGTNLAIEAEKVEITGVEHLKEFIDRDTTSGTPMARCFCMHCGT
jgi:hypothetical protein